MSASEAARFDALRSEMIEQVVEHARDIGLRGGAGALQLAPRVLAAMARLPRHRFVPPGLQALAYCDSPLPIGHGATISQPFMAALMTHLLDPQPGDRVLEVGTGLGYQTALLASLVRRVHSMDVVPDLIRQARQRVHDAGLDNVTFACGDGALGWPQHGPFDGILCSAAPELIPPALIAQLAPGGRLVLPAGLVQDQSLILVHRDDRGHVRTETVLPVRCAVLQTPHAALCRQLA